MAGRTISPAQIAIDMQMNTITNLEFSSLSRQRLINEGGMFGASRLATNRNPAIPSAFALWKHCGHLMKCLRTFLVVGSSYSKSSLSFL